MLHKLETEPSDMRESSYLESLLSDVGWEYVQGVDLVVNAVEKLGAVVTAKDNANLLVGKREMFSRSRFDELVRRSCEARNIVTSAYTRGFTVESAAWAVNATVEIGSALADLSLFLMLADVHLDTEVDIISEEGRRAGDTEVFRPEYLFDPKEPLNGRETTLLYAARLVKEATALVSAAMDHRFEAVLVSSNYWFQAVPQCVSASQSVITVAISIQKNSDKHDKEMVAKTVDIVTRSLGVLMKKNMKSEIIVRGLRATTGAMKVASNLWEGNDIGRSQKQCIDALSCTSNLVSGSSLMAEAISNWHHNLIQPVVPPELDTLVLHVLGATQSACELADYILASTESIEGDPNETVKGVLMSLAGALDAVVLFTPMIRKRAVLDEVTMLLPEMCEVFRKAAVLLDKYSSDEEDRHRSEAQWIQSACKVVEEMCIISRQQHSVVVLKPVVTAAVEVLRDSARRSDHLDWEAFPLEDQLWID